MSGSDEDLSRLDREPPEASAPAPEGAVATETVPAGAAREERDRRRLRLLVRVMMIGVVVLAIVRIFILEPYRIPTGSMRPTILDGDVILVNKLPYTIRSLRTLPFTHLMIPYVEFRGIDRLRRGDVVMFDFPGPYYQPQATEAEHYVKRCVAVAGDVVQIVGGRVYVNNREVPPVPGSVTREGHRVPMLQERAFELFRYGGKITVPFEGFEIELDSTTAERWRPLIEGEGVSVAYRNRIVFLGGLPATRYTFRRSYFFALGDNSSNSYDSRFFGFVPFDNLIGKGLLVYWSRTPDGDTRLDRIGTLIR